MKITNCYEMQGLTVLFLPKPRPLTNWEKVFIDGVAYEPVMIMDTGDKNVAIKGSHDFTGKEIKFA